MGAIGWSMYRMHIGTIIVCVGSSTVPATGSFGWQYNASNGVVFRRQIGTESCLCLYIPTLAVLSMYLWRYRKAAKCWFSYRWKQQKSVYVVVRYQRQGRNSGQV